MTARLPRPILLLVGGGAAAAMLTSATLAHLEGERVEAYLDVAGIPTICYGETHGVHLGDTTTHAECEEKLRSQVEYLLRWVYRQVGAVPDPTAAALVSFTYNVGQAAAKDSTVFRRMRQRDLDGACTALLAWKYVTIRGRKVVSAGLLARREKERELCLLGRAPLSTEGVL